MENARKVFSRPPQLEFCFPERECMQLDRKRWKITHCRFTTKKRNPELLVRFHEHNGQSFEWNGFYDLNVASLRPEMKVE